MSSDLPAAAPFAVRLEAAGAVVPDRRLAAGAVSVPKPAAFAATCCSGLAFCTPTGINARLPSTRFISTKSRVSLKPPLSLRSSTMGALAKNCGERVI